MKDQLTHLTTEEIEKRITELETVYAELIANEYDREANQTWKEIQELKLELRKRKS